MNPKKLKLNFCNIYLTFFFLKIQKGKKNRKLIGALFQKFMQPQIVEVFCDNCLRTLILLSVTERQHVMPVQLINKIRAIARLCL